MKLLQVGGNDGVCLLTVSHFGDLVRKKHAKHQRWESKRNYDGEEDSPPKAEQAVAFRSGPRARKSQIDSQPISIRAQVRAAECSEDGHGRCGIGDEKEEEETAPESVDTIVKLGAFLQPCHERGGRYHENAHNREHGPDHQNGRKACRASSARDARERQNVELKQGRDKGHQRNKLRRPIHRERGGERPSNLIEADDNLHCCG
mmetsp:Transcript_33969/g.80142  ORF Transcript_33969/g.80142 Transcript_33969/m.80142 type:complete len:204 (+) Transcript_33969:1859-2470(+)